MSAVQIWISNCIFSAADKGFDIQILFERFEKVSICQRWR